MVHSPTVKNISKIYVFQFFWIFAIILPVLYPYYASLGINTHQFFQLQAVFGLTVALFEIPTGYFSDHFGRKQSLCVGGFLSGISYLVLTQATGYWGLLFHEFLLGLALSFVSGADIAILFDSLPANSSRDVSSSILGRHQMAASLGESIAAVLCTVLLISFSYNSIIVLQAFIAWLPLFVAFTLHEPKKHKHNVLEIGKIKILWKQILHDRRLIRLLTFHFVIWMLASFIAIWLIQKYWQERGVPIAWFGLLWAGSNILIGITGLSTRWFEKTLGVRNVLLFVGVLCVAAYLFMSISNGWIGIVCGFFVYIARGINNIVSRDILNQIMQPELRATANSIINFLFRFSFAIVGPGIGFAIDRWGLNSTLFVIGGLFAVCLLFVTVPLWRSLKLSQV